VTDTLFYLIIAVQIMLLFRGLIKKDPVTSWFSVFSVILTLLILGLLEYKVHHFLRSSYRIPNTAVYASGLIIISIFIWNFKRFILMNHYNFLFLGGGMWILYGAVDLITDAKLVYIPYADMIEMLLLIAGTFFLLIFYISVFIKTYPFNYLRRFL
jgi:hypothetical protein